MRQHSQSVNPFAKMEENDSSRGYASQAIERTEVPTLLRHAMVLSIWRCRSIANTRSDRAFCPGPFQRSSAGAFARLGYGRVNALDFPQNQNGLWQVSKFWTLPGPLFHLLSSGQCL